MININDKNKGGSIARVIMVLCAIIAVLVIYIAHGYIKSEKEKAYQQGLSEAGVTAETIQINGEITIDVATIRKILAPASKLISYEYHYTDVGVYEKSSKIFGKIDIPFTTDKTLYTYSGKISVGINLDEIEFDVNKDKKLITANYPKIRVMTHDMDKSFEFYDLKKATFNKSDFNDFEEFRLGLRNKEEAKVMRDSEFITNAKANTEAVIEGLISAKGMLDEYTIIHKWK